MNRGARRHLRLVASTRPMIACGIDTGRAGVTLVVVVESHAVSSVRPPGLPTRSRRQAPDHISPVTSVPLADARVTSGSDRCVERPCSSSTNGASSATTWRWTVNAPPVSAGPDRPSTVVACAPSTTSCSDTRSVTAFGAAVHRLELGPRFDDGHLRIDGRRGGRGCRRARSRGEPQLEADADVGDVGADVPEAGGVVARQRQLATLDAEHRVPDRRWPPRSALPGAAQVLDDEVAAGIETDRVGDEGVRHHPARVRRAHRGVILDAICAAAAGDSAASTKRTRAWRTNGGFHDEPLGKAVLLASRIVRGR